MPLCVGFCVLLAIVFVLSRKGDSEAIYNSHSQMRAGDHTVNNANVNANVIKTTTTTTAPITLIPEATGAGSSMDSTSSYSSSSYSTGGTLAASGSDSSSSSSSTTTTFDLSQCPPPPPCPSSSSSTSSLDNMQAEDSNALMAALREKALASTPPHIIECAKAEAGESQAACHLPPKKRYAALGQKGATLWMTGCSGAGKTTIATALEKRLVALYGKHVYRLDGDNLRTGLNRDLTFSEADRAESVRRTGELATLFSDAGIITLVGLISPYRDDRDKVRKRHEDQGIPFYEIFLDVPIDELKNRDPKGQYAKVEAGELKHFTCIDDPYEEPLHPEITLKTHELRVEDSVNILFRQLEQDGILQGAPKAMPESVLPNPDGDLIVDLHVPPEQRDAKIAEAAALPKVLLQDIDLNWLQTIGEGWAAPLRGFMREGALLETLHFNSILTDTFNLTGNVNRLQTQTDFANFPEHPAPNRVSMSLPITLSCTSFTKDLIESSGASAVALVTQMGQTVAILRDPEIYNNRKEEIVTRMYGVIDMDHPYIAHIYKGGDYLIGGEVELLDRIRYNDGLDKWRKTTTELLQEFHQKGADTVYAFQTRNPTHAGHAYLMRSAGGDLKQQGYRKPVLWLSPLGGWTKEDDVPLDVRVQQHEDVLEAGYVLTRSTHAL
jgi:3'-phosphoadenosine 5'-phosphosulfate synthase